MRPPFFVDQSGNGGRIPVKGCFVASCVLCGKKQYLSRLALSRRTRQMCGCGGALELSEQTQKREGLALALISFFGATGILPAPAGPSRGAKVWLSHQATEKKAWNNPSE